MRRIGLFFIVFYCAAALFPDSGGSIFSKVSSDLAKIGIRAENSDQEKAYFSYIESKAAELGLAPRSFDFSAARDSYSFSRIISIRLEGRSPDTLAIAVSADNAVSPKSPRGPPGSEHDAASALALAFLDAASKTGSLERPLSLEFLFLGAEYPGALAQNPEAYPQGSKLAISEILKGKTAALIYLTMDRLSREVRIDNYAPGIVSPYWVFKNASDALSSTGFTARHRGNLSLFYRASLLEDSCAASPYLEAGLPAIALGRAGEPCAAGEEGETAERWISFIGDFIHRNGEGIPETWDKHYFTLDFPFGLLVLVEPVFVLVILGVILAACLVFMLSSIFARETVIGLIAGFGKSFFSLPLCLFSCLAALYGSTLLMSAAFALKGGPDFWWAAPVPYMAAHGIITLAAFGAVCVFLLRFKLLPLTISFYGAGSALLFFAAIFVYSAVDVSFSVFFAWASVACLLAMLFKNRLAGILSYILILAPFALLLSTGAFKDSRLLQGLLISPDPWQCLVLAVLVMPLLFFFIRLILLFHREASPPGRKIALGAYLSCGILAAAATLFLFIYSPYSPGAPIPLSAVEERTGPRENGELRIDSPARPGRGWIAAANYRIELPSRSISSLALPPDGLDECSLSAVRTDFLNRKRISVVFGSKRALTGLGCSIESDSRMDIYDCSFPFELSDDGKRARIFIGANPRAPLRLELTVARDFEARLQAVFESAAGGPVSASPGLAVSRYLRRDLRSVLLR